jgi:hypothetical protein
VWQAVQVSDSAIEFGDFFPGEFADEVDITIRWVLSVKLSPSYVRLLLSGNKPCSFIHNWHAVFTGCAASTLRL